MIARYFVNTRLFFLLLLLLPFRGFSQSCTLKDSLSSSSPDICSGNAVILTPTLSGGTGPYNYIWSTGETTQTISVNKAGTYTVSVTDKSTSCPAVTASISVGVSTMPNAPTASSTTVCENSPATLKATAPGGTYQWYDAATGGNFLATGDTFTTPPITTATTYYVQTTLSNCTSARTAVTVYTAGRPSVTNTSVCSGNGATLTASGGTNYVWYDSAAETNQLATGPIYTTPAVTKTTTYYVVATVNGCVSAPTAVIVYISPPPPTPTSSNVTICSGMAASLHANATSGIFDWFDVPTGGTSLISSPDYTTPALTASTTYYVQTSANGCESARTPVTVTVNPIPPAPAAQTSTICYGTSTNLTITTPAVDGSTYQWYDAATGGRLLTSGTTYQTLVLDNTTTYYIQSVNGGCISSRAPVQVIVNPPVAAPSVSGAIVCSGSATMLTATSTVKGGIYQWYNTPTGGTLLVTDSTYTTPALTATAKYYVQTVVGDCTSARTAVSVTVLPSVAAPKASGATICSGNYAVLTASGGSGNYGWYDSPAGGNLLSSAQVFVTSALTTNATYYVQTASNGCESTRTPVTVTVNPITPSPTVSGATSVCAGSTATVSASTTASGGILWYDAATGGTLLGSGNNYTTPALTETTTYYAESNSSTCPSDRTPVTVTVTPTADAQFEYTYGTYGGTAKNPIPVIADPAGGTFTSSPAGLVFVSNTTGEVNIKASKKSKYTIVFTTNGPCPGTSSVIFVTDSIPNGNFYYNGPYCQSGSNPYPTFASNSSAGTFSASPSGLVFVNKTTGQINLNASKPGTYTVSNTLVLSDGSPEVATANVTIDPAARVNAGPNQSVQTGQPVKLAGSVSGASGAIWSGGKGTFSKPNLLNAVYTPAAGESDVTLTLTTTNPTSVCGPASAKVEIFIHTVPVAPTAPGTSVCMGSSTTLSALTPGGTYRWYDSATDGTLLSTGPNYITPPLTATTTYYVQTTANGLTSARTPVTITVNQTPVAPVVAPTGTCMGSPAILIANGSTGTYKWYDAAAGGNLLATGSTFTTSPLLSNTIYYVQAVIDDCISPRTKVSVSVNPVPNITSSPNNNACGGIPLNYVITSDTPGATYSWSRAQVTGISNPAVTAQTSGTITEALINTSAAPIDVTYLITPLNNGCSGPVFKYVVTVYPTPAVTSSPTATICDNTTDDYAITFSVPQTIFTWSRAAVPGITNAAVSGQTAGTIREVLFNTTTAPIAVPYTINYQTSNCQAQPFTWTETINPTAYITSADAATTCSGTPQNYTITSNIPSATFSWERDTANSISNKPVSNQTSATIDETLVNTGPNPVKVSYIITPIAFGCPGAAFAYTVTLNPQPAMPVTNSNSPICVGSTIQLRTPVVRNATYLWTGPNNYSSTLQNPDITNVTLADTGIYHLYVTVNSCTSPAGTTQVMIHEPPKADAGPNQLVCINIPSIQLAGKVTGGTTTGIWTPSGSGTFSPSSNDLNAKYIPSAEDRAVGTVTLTLRSTSTDDCNFSISSMTITFGPSPAVSTGGNRSVCIQEASVPLKAQIFIPGGSKWSTSGSGSFTPSVDELDATYTPSAADKQSGSVKLTLTANNPGECYIPSDTMLVKFSPPPTVNAGGIRYVLRGHTITLDPVVSETDVTYLWSPNIDINNATSKNPVITGDIDRSYTLAVTDSLGCVTYAQTQIIVSPELVIPNAFTPNGDGINDYWDIKGLVAYTNAIIDVFNRYGAKLYHSVGYPTPWDGKYNGQQLPVGTYYYIINTNVNNQVLSGSLTIIR
ncbi:PKD-like domain-containing protein [Mucilaginibacter sp. X5P1]|uniref:Ig-like domain-containing protein n=1 Tax=Mucilaginibacter sp. X5P1 TaxID=2723088 RepID=UPI0016130F87|nr:PKD-like domain-containing protein [Mucilaginibacter sp. X5P1]MBB6138219.1 gliding motility-associated-like protein [Mucilaginibacter sp. X5P1]